MRWNMGQEFTLIVLLKTANTKPPSCPLVLWLNLLTPTRSPMIDPVSYIYIHIVMGIINHINHIWSSYMVIVCRNTYIYIFINII